MSKRAILALSVGLISLSVVVSSLVTVSMILVLGTEGDPGVMGLPGPKGDRGPEGPGSEQFAKCADMALFGLVTRAMVGRETGATESESKDWLRLYEADVGACR